MYKREEGVNHEVAGVLFKFFVVCFYYSLFFFFSSFVSYLYSRRAHKTREHVFHRCRGMCAANVWEHTYIHMRTHTCAGFTWRQKQTRRKTHRQQGHVAHNRHTLDSRPQSNLFLLPLLLLLLLLLTPCSLSPPLLHFTPLSPSATRLSPDLIYLWIFRTHSCAPPPPFLAPPPSLFSPWSLSRSHALHLCSLSSLRLSVCLTAVVGFCIALVYFFFSLSFNFFLFLFYFWDSIYLYKWCKE